MLTYVIFAVIIAMGAIGFVWLLLRARSEASRPEGATSASRSAPPDRPSFGDAAQAAPPSGPPPSGSISSEPPSAEDDEVEMTFVARRPADLEAALRAEAAMDSIEIDLATAEEPEEDVTGPIARILVSACGHSDQGLRREHNEDAFLILRGELFVVADGMGGYAAGEVASQLAVDTLTAAYETKHFGFEPDPKLPRRGDELVRAIRTANRVIFEEAQRDESKRGMGTTIVAAAFSPRRQRAYLGHVGDSRIYRLRRGELTQLTQDHTLSAALGIKGRRGAQLTRALGIADDVDVDLLVDTPEGGDLYLLCSDGLSKMVDHESLTQMLIDATDLDATVAGLVDEANARGGKDNVSVILVRVEDLPASEL